MKRITFNGLPSVPLGSFLHAEHPRTTFESKKKKEKRLNQEANRRILKWSFLKACREKKRVIILTGGHWPNGGLLVETVEDEQVLVRWARGELLDFLSVLLKVLLQIYKSTEPDLNCLQHHQIKLNTRLKPTQIQSLLHYSNLTQASQVRWITNLSESYMKW